MREGLYRPAQMKQRPQDESVARGAGRTCLGCGRQSVGRELLRFVCAPTGEVWLDHTHRMPGRGAYICCDIFCLQQAMKIKKMSHAFRRNVIVPEVEAVCQDVRRMLCQRLGSYLGISQKAGEIVSGHALLEKAFLQARVFYIILAEDVAIRRAEEYRAWCMRYTVPYVTLFTKDELGRLVGKSSRSAIGLTASHFLASLQKLLASLERLQTTHGAPETQASFS
ncbi:MAG: DUF448 domain-containing protein [Candidatus Tectimicrobiota bacterium]